MRVGGSIVLGKGWKLSKNKDDLTQHKEQLHDAIFVRIEPMLQKAAALSESIESAQLRCELEQSLNAIIREANGVNRRREARSPGESHGSVLPKYSGRTRQQQPRSMTQRARSSSGAKFAKADLRLIGASLQTAQLESSIEMDLGFAES